MYSVLSKVNNAKIVKNPYPYLVIDNALPSNYYNKLNDSFPDYLNIINIKEYKQNFAYRYSASQSLLDNSIPDIWKDFIIYHTSYNFVEEFYKSFEQPINKYYPQSKGRLPTKNNCGLTTIKDKLTEDIQRDRINPKMVEAFRKNPYTQSLSSAL